VNWLHFDYMKEDINNNMPFHTHRKFEIYYFHRGKCKFLIHNRVYELEQGDIMILDGLTRHCASTLPAYPYIRTTIEFLPEFIEPVLVSLQASRLLSLFQELNNSLIRLKDKRNLSTLEEYMVTLHRMMERTKEKPTNTTLWEGEIKVFVTLILYEVYRLSYQPAVDLRRKQTLKERQLERIIHWIHDHYMEKITLKRIADELAINKHYISHLFREITGITARQYILNYRLDQARYLLELNPEQPISEIALQVGFESIPHFSRLFRQHFNVSPSTYRKQLPLIE
jgi:AraC family transcriptional regulator, melibiose operon regulatory protein